MLNATYSMKPNAKNPDLVDLAITPKSLIKLTCKITAYSLVPYVVMFGGFFVAGLIEKPKPTNTEDHLPEDA